MTKLESPFTRPSWLIFALVAGAAWYVVIRILWTDWTIDPQYSYGLLVPLLVVGLLLKRWEDRPEPSPLIPVSRAIVMLILFGATLMIMAVIPMSEANPDWRPLGGAISLAAVILSLSLVALIGGMTWLRHFAFPICFFLIAVPWPRNFEQAVMFPLMEWNTTATLEVLHWGGFEAVNQGNLIVLPSGILGIEEACSGIRSLQSGLMVSLFFGEVFRLVWYRRFALLLVAGIAALLGNVCRSSLLALLASSRGVEAISAWHDRAGMLVLLITFGATFAFAWHWRNRAHSVESGKSAAAVEFSSNYAPLLLPVVLALLMGSLFVTELWFAAHERKGVTPWGWSLHQHQGVRRVSEVSIAPSTLRMLFYPEGFSEKWVANHGESGQVFYFEWPAGRTAAQAMSMHNPEVCLSNIGIVLRSKLQPVVFALNGEKLVFKAWLFDDRGIPVYVFHMLQEQGAETGDVRVSSDSPVGRLRALLAGHRNHGQRMIEIAFWNLPNEDAAHEALARYLHDAIAPSRSASAVNGRTP